MPHSASDSMPLSTASASGLPRRFLGFERTGQLLEERSRSGVGAGRRGDEEPKRRTFLEQRQSFQPRIIRGEKARQDRSPRPATQASRSAKSRSHSPATRAPSGTRRNQRNDASRCNSSEATIQPLPSFSAPRFR